MNQEQNPPLPPSPFLPPQKTSEYTLVLDMDETLIHVKVENNTAKLLFRPGVRDFLNSMRLYYEIVVFTSAEQPYADIILDQLDTNKAISHRLYRQHTYELDGVRVKDLSLIGRDLRKTLIMDNLYENFRLQSDNGIGIKSWEGDMEDQALKLLQPLLIEIVFARADDVREALTEFRREIVKGVAQGIPIERIKFSLGRNFDQ